MGILNVTPDSFSDGGRWLDPGRAIGAGLAMIEGGAAIIDIGGESTRPGATPVPPDEEAARILSVIAGLREAGVPLSVDTRNASTMAAALDAGAHIINDVSALTHDPASLPLVARRACPVILMHMRGTPQTMTGLTRYGDVVADVIAELGRRVEQALDAGITRARIAIDPGFGFAKDAVQNVTLLRGLAALRRLSLPIVAGLSRKRFLGTLAGAPGGVPAADAESLAASLFAIGQGVSFLRVHDVSGTNRALRVWQALSSSGIQ